MLNLFGSVKIGNVTVSNRFMRSATWEGRADGNGMPLKSLLSLMKGLANGEVGLIVPGFMYIKNGRTAPAQTGIFTKEHAAAWKDTLADIHKGTSSKVVFQIVHGGTKCTPEMNDGAPVLAPSNYKQGREMSVAEIEDVLDGFVQAAKHLKEAGADGIQLHCAHGYLLSEFLSPAINKRTDKYGGSDENRLRLVAEIAEQVRKAVGDLMISAKINAYDFVAGGTTPELCAWYISQLKKNVDLFEVSCSVADRSYASRVDVDEELIRKTVPATKGDADKLIRDFKTQMTGVEYYEGFNLGFARVIRRLVPDANLAVVGGLRTRKMMEDAIKEGFQLVSLSRPFIRQPDLVKKLRESKTDKSDCLSCGLCGYTGIVKCAFPSH